MYLELVLKLKQTGLLLLKFQQSIHLQIPLHKVYIVFYSHYVLHYIYLLKMFLCSHKYLYKYHHSIQYYQQLGMAKVMDNKV